MASGHKLTKAQCQRAAELATPDELQRFAQLDQIQKACMILNISKGMDEAAREARTLVRQILKRDSP